MAKLRISQAKTTEAYLRDLAKGRLEPVKPVDPQPAPQPIDKPYDTVAGIMAWEGGEMETEEEVIEFFQHLIDTGMAWTLQGCYGRTAAALIDQGLCMRKGA